MIKKLNTNIRLRQINLDKFQLVNKTTSLDKPKSGSGKRLSMLKSWFITGNTKKPLSKVKENFVPHGYKHYELTKEQRINFANKLTGKKGISDLKKTKKTRRDLAKTIAEKEAGSNRLIKREAIKQIMDPSKGFSKKAKEKVASKYAAQRRTELRGKGVRFIRKNGRIIPIRPKRKK